MDKTAKSTAVVRKRQDTELMPPPIQAKKIKRPKKVLDEDSYTEALSQIIARDFFPGLLESQTQQEYLDALESKDQAWISSASRRLKHVMTPGRKKHPAAMRPSANADATPMSFRGDTPASIASAATATQEPQLDLNMSLSKFQETYTSEDNESFYKLVDKQNQKKAEKYEWLWRGNNKLPSKQMLAQKQVTDRLSNEGRLIDDGFKRDRLAIKDADERPARPDAWNAAPKNGLMFSPELDEGVPTVAKAAEDASRMAPKSINYVNTRIPEPAVPERPPSPTMSSIRDAIAGKPRKSDRDSSIVSGGETPRVNGYAFVDDEDDEDDTTPAPVINLGPGDAYNPFRIQQQRTRETIHEQMVEKIARSKKEASRSGMTGRVAELQTPKFPSSPKVSGNLSPAGQRLWGQIGSPRRMTPGGVFGEPTPRRSRSSLLKNMTKGKEASK